MEVEGGGSSHVSAFLHSDLCSVRFLPSDFIHPPGFTGHLLAGLTSQQTACGQWTVPGWAWAAARLSLPPQCLSLASTWEPDGTVAQETLPGSSQRDASFRWWGGMPLWYRRLLNQESQGLIRASLIFEGLNNKAERAFPRPLASPFQAAFSLTQSLQE